MKCSSITLRSSEGLKKENSMLEFTGEGIENK